MKTLDEALQQKLREIFGERVSFDLHERKLYDHDAAALPVLVRPLAGETLPAAVVQPTNEAQLIALVRLANLYEVPLTPRGRGTSSYGGAVPSRDGIVVDFSHMRRIVNITPDGEGYTVSVEPGITWKKLDEELAEIGLAVRLYPSSAPGSTVGGWLAQGGAGVGSYEFGYFAQNVVGARLVLPDASVKEFRGDDLQFVVGAQGITGLISLVELRVRFLEDTVAQLWSFSTVGDLVRALTAVREANLPLWSVTFFDPTTARFRNQLPTYPENKHNGHDRPLFAHAYHVLFAYPASRRQKLEPALPSLLEPLGTRLPETTAAYEWQERFNPRRIKRLGPSLIPAEAVVPLSNLETFIYQLYDRIDLPVAFHGTVIGTSTGNLEVALLGFIPNDERRLDYNLAYTLSLTVVEIAKELGGRAYAAGLHLAQERDAVLGGERARTLDAFKSSTDPHNIMNPGKISGPPKRHWAMGLARAAELITRPLGSRAGVEGRERTRFDREVPARVVWNAYACVRCGYCLDNCPQYRLTGWESASPRGKLYFVHEWLEGREALDRRMLDTLLWCATCDLCTISCQLDMVVEPTWCVVTQDRISGQAES